MRFSILPRIVRKYPFVSGTILLTATGIISRIIGFFYRIFLSQNIGEEGMGIYQLIAPVMAISFSLTCAGIQTSISKYTASYMAEGNKKSCMRILTCGFLLSFVLSVLCTIIMYRYSDFIAGRLLLEQRCAPLVRIYALSLPLACLHSCINGYYYGLKKSLVPSVTQLAEQLARVGSVFAIYTYSANIHAEPSIAVTMLGILIGEICSTFLSVLAAIHHFRTQKDHAKSSPPPRSYGRHLIEITTMAGPLIANRLTLNLLQSVEAVQIPNMLLRFGMTQTEALSSYGVLTGMTFPLILFPCAITSSISVLLLPYISEAHARKDSAKIKSSVTKCVAFCLLLGSFFCLLFLSAGPALGRFLFHSKLAGSYIQALSITCPLLYLSGVLTSTLHGLGKPLRAFLYNAVSLLVRLLFVFLLMPRIGMYGYLIGILVSELLLVFLLMSNLKRSLLI